ncbi:DUF6193 family natural product biosynthesis protein [Kitasatospora sp. NPDC007106]|uniref:DUF6193 family natural product biosynthesis protein n=1 Tax=Kitasatospora sp. NPDC007106 TaxID=3156914 RepID=UPI0033C2E97C
MTIRGGDNERDREWRATLDAWRPPHQPGERFGPALWSLLEPAAQEPVLRGLFPWTSMNALHVSATGDFRDYSSEPFPAIAASTCGFLVMTHPWGPDRVVLDTADPAIALACMVRLTGDQISSPVPGDGGREGVVAEPSGR